MVKEEKIGKNRISPITINPVAISSGDEEKTLNLQCIPYRLILCFGTLPPDGIHPSPSFLGDDG